MQPSLPIITLTVTASSAMAGFYDQTCRGCSLSDSNTDFGCFCKRPNGTEGFDILNLNRCFVNRNGRIEPQRDGGFGDSCHRDGDLGRSNLPCWICETATRGENRSCPCLSCFIFNKNGTLAC